MGAKRISLSAGFEDLLGTLRGSTGELPSEGEMRSVSGDDRGSAASYYDALLRSGSDISKQIRALDRQLQAAEENMRDSIAQQRATEAQAAETLRKILTDLEGVRTEVAGDSASPSPDLAKSAAKNEKPGAQW